jgi:glutamate/tyrosine decarboxylase-like PLP-dependent enzyme
MKSMADDEIVYLDNNATTPLDPAVIEEMLTFLTKYYGNPSSGYAFAARARKAVDLARERLAALLGCAPSEIVFTSGGTESNNAVIHSALAYSAVAAAKAGLAKEGYPWLITKSKRRENLLLRVPISPGVNCLRGAFQFLLRKFLLQGILNRLL